MLEKVLFDLIAVALFIVILIKVISKNDSNYIIILILEAVGILTSFVEIKLKMSANIFFKCIRYFFSIIIPVLIIFMELKGINFSELISASIATLLLYIGNDKAAKSILIKLVTKYPQSYIGHKLLAQIYEKEGGMRKAIDEYVKLVDLKGNDYKSYFKIADLLNELGQKNEAIQMLENLLRTKPDSYEGSILLGNLLCEAERFKEAEKVYQDALKYNPNDFDLYYNLGIVYTMLNEFQMAKESYEMAAEINHRAYGANYNLGQIALIFGDLEVAEEYFEKSLYEEFEPSSYYQLAKIFAIKGEKSMAINFLNKAIELEPKLLKKANKEKVFEAIRHMITVSVKMEEKKEEENIEKEEKKKEESKNGILKLEIVAREYLESTNVLIMDINENTEKQIISQRVDKIFETKRLEDKKNKEKEARQKELGSD